MELDRFAGGVCDRSEARMVCSLMPHWPALLIYRQAKKIRQGISWRGQPAAERRRPGKPPVQNVSFS
jgi:hypothetical protein